MSVGLSNLNRTDDLNVDKIARTKVGRRDAGTVSSRRRSSTVDQVDVVV